MNIYAIKVALRGISPMIWRRLQLSGNTSLADLHHIIQLAMGWENDYLHSFHISGKDYGIAYEGGLSFSDNPLTVILDDFGFDIGDRFTYTYNFYDHWLNDIRIEAIQPIDDITAFAPYCYKGQGRFIDNKPYYRTDEQYALSAILVGIFHGNEATITVGDIRLLIEKYEAIRFNRQAINTLLSQPLSDAIYPC